MTTLGKMLPRLLIVALFVCLAIISFSYLSNSETETSFALDVKEREIINGCVNSIAKDIEQKTDLDYSQALNFAFAHCLDISYNALYLEDFRIRKKKLVDQGRSEPIILWMVVLITLSGVALSAYQIFASYQLAAKLGSSQPELGGEINSTDAGFVIKSTVTGLLILVVSFAFFLTYINSVYKIDIQDLVDPNDKKVHSNALSKLPVRNSESQGGFIVAPSVISEPKADAHSNIKSSIAPETE
jgi:hypothetical protein